MPCTAWAEAVVHHPAPHLKFPYWIRDIQFISVFSPAFPISYPRHSGDNLQSNQTILNQDVQGAVPSSCSLDDDEKSDVQYQGNQDQGKADVRTDMEKENQQTWRVKNDP